jgi:hypothetical protein
MLQNIQRVAVLGPVIVGQYAKGYFLLDSRTDPLHPQEFPHRKQWQAALKHAGLPADPQLSNPDALVAGFADQTLRPWKYKVMGGRLRLSDVTWSLIVQIGGFAIAFVLGLMLPYVSLSCLLAILLGVVVNIIAMIYLGEGRGAAFVGFVIFPLYYCLTVWIARGVRWLAFTVGRPLLKSPPID